MSTIGGIFQTSGANEQIARLNERPMSGGRRKKSKMYRKKPVEKSSMVKMGGRKSRRKSVRKSVRKSRVKMGGKKKSKTMKRKRPVKK